MTETEAAKSGSRARPARVSTAAGAIVCAECLIADTPPLRMRGLLGRRELPVGEGLLIKPTNAIHMWFMRFAIDAVFLDRDDVVLRVASDLRPWRMAMQRGARSVLELPAGHATQARVQAGDRLIFDADGRA